MRTPIRCLLAALTLTLSSSVAAPALAVPHGKTVEVALGVHVPAERVHAAELFEEIRHRPWSELRVEVKGSPKEWEVAALSTVKLDDAAVRQQLSEGKITPDDVIRVGNDQYVSRVQVRAGGFWRRVIKEVGASQVQLKR